MKAEALGVLTEGFSRLIRGLFSDVISVFPCQLLRELNGRKSELNRMQSQHALTADREKELEDEMERVKNEYQDKVASLQRRIADLQNTKIALERQLTAAEDDAQDRIRAAESAM